MKISGSLACKYQKVSAELIKYKDRNFKDKQTISNLQARVKNLSKKLETDKIKYEEKIKELEAIIKKLENELAHKEALLNHDGTNTGIPTSKTPIGKEKRVPNSRENTGKNKGGQIGHKKSSLIIDVDPDAIEIVGHPLADNEGCPKCGLTNCTPTGESEVKYEYDVLLKVIKRKHEYYFYECNNCGTIFRSKIPPELKEEYQYGNQMQSLILSLTNTVNSSMNKVCMFLRGITNGKLSPCEGYVAKLQERAAKRLLTFRDDLKRELITRKLIYWDDTVIMILKKRACFRFYGDETIAYYTAHEHKNMESLDNDNVLDLITSDTKIMHDHNCVNYNEKYSFKNIECNQHLQRDCQKNTDDTGHKWSKDLKELISLTIKDRNEAVANNITAFDSNYITKFYEKVDKYLTAGKLENEADKNKYGTVWEKTLLNRIKNFKEPYFMWVEDFNLPTTNNLSERGLRGVKSHMKISGQFESIKAADNYAIIKTYIETCRRNHINEIDALKRLCSGNPYKVSEIFSSGK